MLNYRATLVTSTAGKLSGGLRLMRGLDKEGWRLIRLKDDHEYILRQTCRGVDRTQSACCGALQRRNRQTDEAQKESTQQRRFRRGRPAV